MRVGQLEAETLGLGETVELERGDSLAVAQPELEGEVVRDADALLVIVAVKDAEDDREGEPLWQPDVETVRVGDAVLLVEAETLAVGLNEWVSEGEGEVEAQ